MTYHYSVDPITFYHDEYSTIPDHAMPLTDDEYAALIAGQEEGRSIIATDDLTLTNGPAPVVNPAIAATASYAAFLARGLMVTSAANPKLNAVYAIDDAAQSNIAVEAQFITSFSEFTNGATSDLAWQTLNGQWVSFNDTASFMDFAKAAGQTVAAAKLAVSTGRALPSASVTIP